MKQSAIIELSTKELQDRIATEKTQLVKLQMTHAISPIENPKKITESRKTVARLMTELTKRLTKENSN
ncbi:MAG: 50S ribosomal protein L29 [Bacteroidota bacterium]